MREIKFRAWDLDAKKWKGMWVFRGGHDGEKSHYNEPDVFDLVKIFSNPKYSNTKNIVLQQLVIGDLFEGDVVRDIKNKDWKVSIIWEEYGFTFSQEHPGNRSLSELVDRGRLEIIGNIYETPDLLPPHP